jgi:hypothetical protein
MKTIRKGDLLIPRSEDAKKIWGKGVVDTPMVLDCPPAHCVFWFGYKRNTVIEESIIMENFDVIQLNEGIVEI